MINKIANNSLNFKGKYTLGNKAKKQQIVQDIMQVCKTSHQQEMIANKLREYTEFCSSITPDNEEVFVNVGFSPTGEYKETAFSIEHYPIVNDKPDNNPTFEYKRVISDDNGNFFQDVVSQILFTIKRSKKNFEFQVNKRPIEQKEQTQEEKLLSLLG